MGGLEVGAIQPLYAPVDISNGTHHAFLGKEFYDGIYKLQHTQKAKEEIHDLFASFDEQVFVGGLIHKKLQAHLGGHVWVLLDNGLHSRESLMLHLCKSSL